MLVLVVSSEEEFLDLIADLSEYGIHEPNGFAPKDENGLSVCDRFSLLSADMAEEYLGVRDYKWEIITITDEHGEYEEEPVRDIDGPLRRESLYICPELRKHIYLPEDKDYPIIVMFEWGDDFDRAGSIKTRYFDWISMASGLSSHKNGETVIKQKKDLWEQTYREEFDKWCEENYQRQEADRERARHGSKDTTAP
jgi:hypothetical protein